MPTKFKFNDTIIPEDWRQHFQPFDLSLNPWAGRTVKIELLNDPTGWKSEAATWHDIRITATSGTL